MGAKPVDNERKACDAVARAIEELTSTERTNGFSPEDAKIGPPVEYVFDIGVTKYALEHTVTEAFGGQIQSDVDFGKFIAPIREALDGKLPAPGVYHLNFRIDPSKGMKAKQIEQAQASIIAWVQKNAGELHADCPEEPSRNMRPFGHKSSREAVVEGVELGLRRETRWGTNEKFKGRLLIMRIAPDHHDELRRKRVEAALDKKLPKLKKWKDQGARSVLVLENRDIALSNHLVIANALEAAVQNRDDPPDESWLVDTTIDQQWTVWCLIRDGVVFPDAEAKDYWEFEPAKLTEVK